MLSQLLFCWEYSDSLIYPLVLATAWLMCCLEHKGEGNHLHHFPGILPSAGYMNLQAASRACCTRWCSWTRLSCTLLCSVFLTPSPLTLNTYGGQTKENSNDWGSTEEKRIQEYKRKKPHNYCVGLWWFLTLESIELISA